jgi:hypothetical protein
VNSQYNKGEASPSCPSPSNQAICRCSSFRPLYPFALPGRSWPVSRRLSTFASPLSAPCAYVSQCPTLSSPFVSLSLPLYICVAILSTLCTLVRQLVPVAHSNLTMFSAHLHKSYPRNWDRNMKWMNYWLCRAAGSAYCGFDTYQSSAPRALLLQQAETSALASLDAAMCNEKYLSTNGSFQNRRELWIDFTILRYFDVRDHENCAFLSGAS